MSKVYEMNAQNAPSAPTKGELFSGSLGLLNGNAPPYYNIADTEAYQEMAEMLRRKKKRKRGMSL